MISSTSFRQFVVSFKSKYYYHILIVWVIGQLFGFLSGFGVSDQVVSYMRLAGFVKTPLYFKSCFALLPFFLSYFALHFSKHELLLLLVFLKAFAFSYCTCCVAVSFGLAGWLFRWLIFFSDSFSTIIYLLYVLVSFKMQVRQQGRAFSICVILVLSLVIFDHFLVSSFVSTLLQ